MINVKIRKAKLTESYLTVIYDIFLLILTTKIIMLQLTGY